MVPINGQCTGRNSDCVHLYAHVYLSSVGVLLCKGLGLMVFCDVANEHIKYSMSEGDFYS